MEFEIMTVDGENNYVDLNDLLDILETNKKGYYSVIFKDGEAWMNVKLKKKVITKFNNIKKGRNQK